MLRSQFFTKPQQGYSVRLTPKQPDAEFRHLFCGKHNIAGGICPNCQKPLLRFLTLDCKDQRLEIDSSDLEEVHLLFCWSCNIAQRPFAYSLEDHKVSLLQFGRGGTASDFPYEHYPVFFPEWKVILEPISTEQQKAIILLNEGREDECGEVVYREKLNVPRHQIGGVPLLLQFDDQDLLKCPHCRKIMPFFAEIGDDTGGAGAFTGNKFVQVIYSLCRKCRVVGCYQACD